LLQAPSSALAAPPKLRVVDTVAKQIEWLRRLILRRTTPHRRFRSTVVAHRSKPGLLLRRKFLSCRAAIMQTSLASLCHSIPPDPGGQDGKQSEAPDPRNSGSHMSQVNLLASIQIMHSVTATPGARRRSRFRFFASTRSRSLLRLAGGAEADPRVAPPISSGETSIFRNDGTSELEVEAERHDRVGGLGGIGELAVRRERRAGTVVTV
jgi:hypothetical protein